MSENQVTGSKLRGLTPSLLATLNCAIWSLSPDFLPDGEIAPIALEKLLPCPLEQVDLPADL
jgi:hypothetical protein